MPAGTEDLSFGFDTSFFDKGIKKVTSGFSKMENTAQSVAKGVSAGIGKMVTKLGALAVGFASIRGMMAQMPEIGQVFGIAKDIFTRNFLYPLRKQVFPLLQKLLNWVRDSRVRFVKWGNILSNIFRTIVQSVKVFINVVKGMVEGLASFTKKIFGDQAQNADEVMNMISFKISVIISFLSILLQSAVEMVTSFFGGFADGFMSMSDGFSGLFENIAGLVAIFTEVNEDGNSFAGVLASIGELFGKIVGFVTAMTNSFLEGFVPAIENIMTPLTEIFDAFSSIFDLIFGSEEMLKGWGDIFENIGTIIGAGIMLPLQNFADILEFIQEMITSIKEGTFFADAGDMFGGLFENLGGNAAEFFGNVGGALGIGEGRRVNDAILRPDGSVIETNPQDTILAMKDENTSLGSFSGASNRTVSANFDFSGMQVVVQEGGIEEGREFAGGLIDQMRTEYNREFERFGL